jgi:porin
MTTIKRLRPHTVPSCRVNALIGAAAILTPLWGWSTPAASAQTAPSPGSAPSGSTSPAGSNAPAGTNAPPPGRADAPTSLLLPSPYAEPAPAPKPAGTLPEDDWKEFLPLTNPTLELDDIYTPHEGTIDASAIESPLDFFLQHTRSLEEATGLRVGFAYTMIFQQATAGAGIRHGVSGDFDIMFDWTLVGRGTKDTGRAIFTVEDRFKVGPNPASAVGSGVGGLTNTTGGFNDRGWVVRDVQWAQRLFEDRLRLNVGRMDISDFVGGYRLQGINNSFSNRAFSALATAAFPGHGLGAVATFRPSSDFYATAGASNAYGRTSTITASQLFENWDLFYTGEVGYTPDIEGLGQGRYALTLWQVDARQNPTISRDRGFALIAEQDLNETFYVFARYQHAERGVERIRNSVQTGLGINGLLGSRENVTAVAFGYANPVNDALTDEKVVEAFHRWQLTRFTQFSLGVQGIFDPSNAPGRNAVGVFTARFRIAF